MKITLDDVLTQDNINKTIEYFQTKNDSAGIDGVKLSELKEYWELNGANIIEAIYNMSYEPELVENVEIITANGKRRIISKLASIDRVILRCISNSLKTVAEKSFSKYSYAYQEGKGIIGAVDMVCDYLRDGYKWVIEIDIKNYFDNISQEQMLITLKEYIS